MLAGVWISYQSRVEIHNLSDLGVADPNNLTICWPTYLPYFRVVGLTLT